jgi:hypothetical protein
MGIIPRSSAAVVIDLAIQVEVITRRERERDEVRGCLLERATMMEKMMRERGRERERAGIGGRRAVIDRTNEIAALSGWGVHS